MRRLLLLVAALSVAACPPAERKDAPAGQSACARVGQSCEFSAGKLGTCVIKDGCEPASTCFVCQSQH